MKNNKIITSWDKIEPSDSANDRMLSAILEKNRSVHDRKDKVNYMSQRKNFKKFLIPVAACLVAIVAVTGIVGSNMGWFGSKGYTVNLANGDSIVYHIGSTNVASIHVGYPVSSRKLTDAERTGSVGYLGHDPELFDDTIRNNILLGDDADSEKYLKAVCFDKEVAEMEKGEDTIVGNSGIRLSGGQAQRLALARTLCHKRPVLVLDDPFSALDKKTEEQIFTNLRQLAADSVVIILSHRLYLFPQMDQIIWMENGHTMTGTHEQIRRECPEYNRLYEAQATADTEKEGGQNR